MKNMCFVLRAVGGHQRVGAEGGQRLTLAVGIRVDWRGKSRSRKSRVLWSPGKEKVVACTRMDTDGEKQSALGVFWV